MSETDRTESKHGPVDSARNMLDSVLGLLGKRFELAAIELQEEKYRLVDQLFRVIVAGVLGLMSLIMASFFLIVICWDTGARYHVIAGLAVVYGVAAWRSFVVLKRKLEKGPTPFAATIDEMRKDREWFQKQS